jgi:4-amino-4-deoxy-L-arabinose transferase-like glycosyltransferase
LAPAAPEKDAIESRWSSAILLCGLVVLLGVGLRLYRFTDPIPGWHAWRQYDTAAVARNFHQESMNILYPRVDWRGLSPGYVESEFQIYTFSVATLYRIFGMHEWLARLFNLGVYGISVLLLFRLACRLFDRLTALYRVLLFDRPIDRLSTHSFQPDALMSVCSLAAIYYFLDWTENQRTRNLV